MAYNAEKQGHSSKAVREKVLGKCWQFLFVNFDKFSQANKIKIALALGTKSMPQVVEGGAVGETKVIIIRPGDNGGEAVRTDTTTGRSIHLTDEQS